MKKATLLLVLILFVGLCAAGCGKNEEPAGETASGLDIDTTTLSGDAFTSAELSANRLTVFNVWATLCGRIAAFAEGQRGISE